MESPWLTERYLVDEDCPRQDRTSKFGHLPRYGKQVVIIAFHIVSIYQRHQQLRLIPSRADKVKAVVRDDGYSQSDLSVEGLGVRQELIEEIMRFRELHRTVLHHCARSETTIKYLAPLPPIISTGGGWVKPFPSHPDVTYRYSHEQEKTVDAYIW